MLALENARDNQAFYGRTYGRRSLVWEVLSQQEGEDYNEIKLCYRPVEGFSGEPGTVEAKLFNPAPRTRGGRSVAQVEKFCRNCGDDFPEVIERCPKCGQPRNSPAMPPRKYRNPYPRSIPQDVDYILEEVNITWASAFKIAIAFTVVAMAALACYGVFIYFK